MRAGFREHHVPASRLDRPDAMAVSAPALRYTQTPEALARAAVFLPRHGQRVLTASDRVVETDGQRLVQVGSARSHMLRATPLLQQVTEQVAERRGRRSAGTHG